MAYCSNLFHPTALGKMQYLDALIYEAIRLSPPFLGGLEVTTETVELEKDQIQIPKDSNVFVCQQPDHRFDIRQALGKRPEQLRHDYPSRDLYGFLPFRGMEVPLMVLQTKVFLTMLLDAYTPIASKKKRHFPRVRVVSRRLRRSQSFRAGSTNFSQLDSAAISLGIDDATSALPPIDDLPADGSIAKNKTPETRNVSVSGHAVENDYVNNMTPETTMNLFTKIPFPEPRQHALILPRVY
jgi:hypothetical protein